MLWLQTACERKVRGLNQTCLISVLTVTCLCSAGLVCLVTWETSKLHFIDWASVPSCTEGVYWLKRRLLSYLPLRVSCCLMFFIKWTFLKLFGRGEPDRVRHLKCKENTQKYQLVCQMCLWCTCTLKLNAFRTSDNNTIVLYLRKGAFSSMSSSVSSDERWEISLRLERQINSC